MMTSTLPLYVVSSNGQVLLPSELEPDQESSGLKLGQLEALFYRAIGEPERRCA